MLYDNFKISHLNIGCGEDISIKELALKIIDIIGFKGSILFDTSKPDGTPQKLLDISRLQKNRLVSIDITGIWYKKNI